MLILKRVGLQQHYQQFGLYSVFKQTLFLYGAINVYKFLEFAFLINSNVKVSAHNISFLKIYKTLNSTLYTKYEQLFNC